MVGDLFGHDQRSFVFGIFYLAIPVGSALGFLVGGQVAAVTGDWRWAMRVTPGLNLVAAILIVVFMHDPPRGESDGLKMVGLNCLIWLTGE